MLRLIFCCPRSEIISDFGTRGPVLSFVPDSQIMEQVSVVKAKKRLKGEVVNKKL